MLEMGACRAVIIYHITYDDGEEVTAAFIAQIAQRNSEHPLSHDSHATAERRNRWQRICARSRHGEFVLRPRRTCCASSSAPEHVEK